MLDLDCDGSDTRLLYISADTVSYHDVSRCEAGAISGIPLVTGRDNIYGFCNAQREASHDDMYKLTAGSLCLAGNGFMSPEMLVSMCDKIMFKKVLYYDVLRPGQPSTWCLYLILVCLKDGSSVSEILYVSYYAFYIRISVRLHVA